VKKVRLTNTALEVSPIAMGTGNFKDRLDYSEASAVLDAYLDLGGNFIDTANVYCRWLPDTTNSSEQYLGRWLSQRKCRDKVVLATKGGHPSLVDGSNQVNRQQLTHELEESLTTMGVEYVDFYWFHRDNESMPMEEIIAIGEDFVRQGKVRYYGASNFGLKRMREAQEIWEKTGTGFRALSNRWSLAQPNPGYKLNGDPTMEDIDHDFYLWLQQSKLPLVPYSSTASGYFCKAAKGELPQWLQDAYGNEKNKQAEALVSELAEKYQATPHMISLAILLHQDFPVFPVTAFSNRKQLEETVKSAEIPLEKGDITRLNTLF